MRKYTQMHTPSTIPWDGDLFEFVETLRLRNLGNIAVEDYRGELLSGGFRAENVDDAFLRRRLKRAWIEDGTDLEHIKRVLGC